MAATKPTSIVDVPSEYLRCSLGILLAQREPRADAREEGDNMGDSLNDEDRDLGDGVGGINGDGCLRSEGR